jgi:hypothetical protein
VRPAPRRASRSAQVGGEEAAVRSPEPFALIGSRGSARVQAPFAVDRQHLDGVAGRSGRSTEVTSTVDGPSAMPRRPSPSVDASVSGSVPVRKPSSNWLGVMTSACGTTCSRMIGGIAGRRSSRWWRCPSPGRRCTSRPGSPSSRAPRRRHTSQDPGARRGSRTGRRHTFGQHAALLDPGHTARTSSGQAAAARATRRTPVWLEEDDGRHRPHLERVVAVGKGWPAEFPTWPYATSDWIDQEAQRPSLSSAIDRRDRFRRDGLACGHGTVHGTRDLTDAESASACFDRARLIGRGHAGRRDRRAGHQPRRERVEVMAYVEAELDRVTPCGC